MCLVICKTRQCSFYFSSYENVYKSYYITYKNPQIQSIYQCYEPHLLSERNLEFNTSKKHSQLI